MANCKYKPGDLVIAKVRGHSAWPARIDTIESKGQSYVFNVIFYGSNDTGICRLSQLSNYEENKQTILQKNTKSKNDIFSLALKEIEEECTLRKQRKNSKRLSKNSSFQSMTQDLPAQHFASTPLRNEMSLEVEINSNTKDIGVNTTQDIDLSFQVKALTERCIELELSKLQETENEITSHASRDINGQDFQTQILIQELKDANLEIQNLKATIQILQSDYRNLIEEQEAVKHKVQQCSHCFPPLLTNKYGNQWQQERNPTYKGNMASNTIKCTNQYSALSDEYSYIETEDKNTHVKDKKPQKHKSYIRRPNNNGEKRKQQNKNEVQPQLLILADSHGRQLGKLIQQRTNNSTLSFVKPGACFNQVVCGVQDLKNTLTKEDHLLVIAGSNNVENTGIKFLMDGIKTLINDTTNNNLILATVPMRHDQPKLDLKISRINYEIEEAARQSPNDVKVLPLDQLPRHYFTAHGLHLNRKGKNKVAEMVAEFIAKQLSHNGKYIPQQYDYHMPHLLLNTDQANETVVLDSLPTTNEMKEAEIDSIGEAAPVASQLTAATTGGTGLPLSNTERSSGGAVEPEGMLRLPGFTTSLENTGPTTTLQVTSQATNHNTDTPAFDANLKTPHKITADIETREKCT